MTLPTGISCVTPCVIHRTVSVFALAGQLLLMPLLLHFAACWLLQTGFDHGRRTWTTKMRCSW